MSCIGPQLRFLPQPRGSCLLGRGLDTGYVVQRQMRSASSSDDATLARGVPWVRSEMGPMLLVGAELRSSSYRNVPLRPKSGFPVGSSVAAYLSVLVKVLFVGGVLKVFLPLLSENDFVVIAAPLSSPETLGSKRGKPPQPGKQC